MFRTAGMGRASRQTGWMMSEWRFLTSKTLLDSRILYYCLTNMVIFSFNEPTISTCLLCDVKVHANSTYFVFVGG